VQCALFSAANFAPHRFDQKKRWANWKPLHSLGPVMTTKKNVTQELSRRAILLQHDYQIFLDGRASSPDLALLFAKTTFGKISAGKLSVRDIVAELGEQFPTA
jgi:hypothetical protein